MKNTLALLELLSIFFAFILVQYGLYRFTVFFFTKSHTYHVKDRILKHRFLLINTWKIPIGFIVEMRTNSEKILEKEVDSFFRFRVNSAPFLAITYSEKPGKYITKYAYTRNPSELKVMLQKAMKS
jgi:hypothetical protein